jgi:hypothetical protein
LIGSLALGLLSLGDRLAERVWSAVHGAEVCLLLGDSAHGAQERGLALGRHRRGVDVRYTHLARRGYRDIKRRRISSLNLHVAGAIGFPEIHPPLGDIECALETGCARAANGLDGEPPHGSPDARSADGSHDFHSGARLELLRLTDHCALRKDEFSF